MMIRRPMPLRQGSEKHTVRGTVLYVHPGQPGFARTGLVGWLLGPVPPILPVVEVRIDGQPHEKLQDIVLSLGGNVSQKIKIHWGDQSPVPLKGDRVWVTFLVATEIEHWLGAPTTVLDKVEPIDKEGSVHENELLSDVPELPLVFA